MAGSWCTRIGRCWYTESFDKYRVSTKFYPISQDTGLIKDMPVVFRNNPNLLS
jgi:hypothetical protein